jgi:hypothetical protein
MGSITEQAWPHQMLRLSTDLGFRDPQLKVYDALWTFVRVEGVEPTNHSAERAIRPGVLWRKGSFGTPSAQGSRFVEAMMTVVATLKQQHRHVLAYMTEACQAAYTGLPAPSHLPRHTEAEEDLPVAA